MCHTTKINVTQMWMPYISHWIVLITQMVHNFIIEIEEWKAEQASALVAFANELARPRDDYFIWLKH